MTLPSPPPAPHESPASGPDRGDTLSLLFSLVFIAWCFVVGTLLLYAPWMPVWAGITASFADPSVRELLAHPTLRGAICGFGLFHLVWGTHDLDGLIARFLRRKLAEAEARKAGDADEGAEEAGAGDASHGTTGRDSAGKASAGEASAENASSRNASRGKARAGAAVPHDRTGHDAGDVTR